MLNWKHIKGFNGTSDHATYSFIEFQHSADASKNENLLPQIIIQNSNGEPIGDVNYGHIITTNVDTTIQGEWTFSNFVHCSEKFYATSGIYFNEEENYYITLMTNVLTIHSDNQINIKANDQVNIESNFSVGTSTVERNSNFYGEVTITGGINALFFNATSDIRAKEHLIPVKSSTMLDLINYMPIYTFNYKNNPQKRSLGIIAQDVQNIDIDGFSLVDNKNASGIDNDFMSIHESKLVYILLGAVQELSKQIEELKKKIGE